MGLDRKNIYCKIILYVLLFFIFFVSFQCSAQLIYVDIENNDGPRIGSSNHPFQHIQDAVDAANPFDIVHIEDGSYEEHIVIEKPITVKGNDSNQPILLGETDLEEAIITISSSEVNLEYIQLYQGYSGVFIENGTNNTVSNLTMISCNVALNLSDSTWDNQFFSNNFVNNTQDVVVSTRNQWNRSSKGNYWDDYNGNDTNHDGVGDEPYIISVGDNIDWFPLMQPVTKKPLADFSFSPSTPLTEDMITFTSLANDTDGFISSWFWDFDDNNMSSEMNPIHQFQTSGTYNVTHMVTDNLGVTNSTSKTITVLNVAPTASFSFTPKNPTDVQQVSFEDGSTDSDGVIVNWTWDFDDNTTSFEQNPVHQFADDNNYLVRLTVEDDHGATDSYTQTITVSNVAPVASFTFTFPNVTALVDQPVYFHDTSIDHDGSIVSREWSFGDNSNSSEKNPSHTYAQKGSYTVSLTIMDDDEKIVTKTKQITVSGTIHHDEVITEFSLFDIVFVVFLVVMIILVIVLSKKYG